MSKKDYELIARILADIRDDQSRWAMVQTFALALKDNNPRFNIITFVRACKGIGHMKSAIKLAIVEQELPQ